MPNENLIERYTLNNYYEALLLNLGKILLLEESKKEMEEFQKEIINDQVRHIKKEIDEDLLKAQKSCMHDHKVGLYENKLFSYSPSEIGNPNEVNLKCMFCDTIICVPKSDVVEYAIIYTDNFSATQQAYVEKMLEHYLLQKEVPNPILIRNMLLTHKY
ncbi:MAG: hypothetical protein N2749_04200 [Clostridia bacterium]|nr:hypothetical protein [Clostridia bacterium]